MSLSRNTAAITALFLSATMTACGTAPAEEPSVPQTPVADTTDWSQPVDRAVLMVRSDGVDVEMLSFEEEPITLGVCRSLGQNSTPRGGDYIGRGSSVTCLNNGQHIGSYRFGD